MDTKKKLFLRNVEIGFFAKHCIKNFVENFQRISG
jgi:hypothetical protein